MQRCLIPAQVLLLFHFRLSFRRYRLVMRDAVEAEELLQTGEVVTNRADIHTIPVRGEKHVGAGKTKKNGISFGVSFDFHYLCTRNKEVISVLNCTNAKFEI